MPARDKQTFSDAMLVYAAMMLNLFGQPSVYGVHDQEDAAHHERERHER